MKRSDILLLAVFLVMGSLIFAIKQKQDSLRADDISASAPVPTLKPAPPQIATIPELRLQFSTPEKAGSYGRLSLDQFLAKGHTDIVTRDTAPKSAAEIKAPAARTLLRPAQEAPLADKPAMSELSLDRAESIKLPSIPISQDIMFEEKMLMERVTQMAASSPIQPDSRGCGPLKQNIKHDAKRAKVRSVGLERQLTDRTSIGVEYVYKDGCYKNAIATLPVGNMPSDDGVNLRVNMQF